MGGLIWAETSYALPIFLLLTGLGCGAAFATGRSFAANWSPVWLIVPASLGLAAAVRFLHYSLFQESLLSIHYFVVTAAILMLVSWFGYRLARSRQMASQYSRSFEKAGLG